MVRVPVGDEDIETVPHEDTEALEDELGVQEETPEPSPDRLADIETEVVRESKPEQDDVRLAEAQLLGDVNGVEEMVALEETLEEPSTVTERDPVAHDDVLIVAEDEMLDDKQFDVDGEPDANDDGVLVSEKDSVAVPEKRTDKEGRVEAESEDEGVTLALELNNDADGEGDADEKADTLKDVVGVTVPSSVGTTYDADGLPL